MSRSYKQYQTKPGGKGYMPPGSYWKDGKLVVPFQKEDKYQIPGTIGHAAELEDIPEELRGVVRRRKR